MKRDAFKEKVIGSPKLTEWVCPECNSGKLRCRDKNIELIEHSNYNKRAKQEEDWLKYGFYGFLECTNSSCKEKIVFSGKAMNDYHIYYDPDIDESYDYTEKTLTVEYIERPPNIIKLNSKYPDSIREILKISFRLYWLDTNSCANKLRICLEALMDEHKIKKFNRTGRRVPIPLDHRIQSFAQKYPHLKEILLAVKWIGNYASHEENISNEDLLDGYTLLEYSLHKLYLDDEAEIKKLSKEINKRKKPRSK